MTTRDITENKVSVSILVACMLFTASGAWAVAWAWFDNKSATERLMERIVVMDAKIDKALQGTWSYKEEKDSWNQVWFQNPGFKVPDIKAIREERNN